MVRKSQEATVDAIKLLADAVQSITSSIPAPNLPYSDRLPRPEELVANAYDFAEQLLTSHRKFAENVLEPTSRCLAPRKARRRRRATPRSTRMRGGPRCPGSPRMTNIKARLEGAHAAP